ncbi:EpsG family protein [Flavobacterium yafengii]|uniref:EpsG family protein n=1 Tax=Flavobacterium yafengii TaxID=3041253 RepID=A0AAW6TMC1_9FLAO|nr:EpsG family protein [Flavobacterium yafengii]MDI5950742.1 EpsG family protein [Flavobacterium yafengii]
MDFYSLPYIILLLVYLLLYFVEKTSHTIFNRKIIRFFCAFLFVFFFGFRGFIGSDWYNYQEYYSEATLSTWTIYDFEIGFSFFVKLFNDLGFSYEFFVFFITSLQVFLFDRFVKNEGRNVALAYICLISLFPLLIIDLLRNFTSILIAIQSIYYINKSKKIRALLLILISITFHTTGVFFLFFFLWSKNYFKKKTLYILLFIGLGIYLSQFRFVDSIVSVIGSLFGGRLEYLAGSITESEQAYGIKIGILEKLFVLMAVLVNYDYIVKNKLISPISFNLFFCYCFIQLYFSTSDSIINRFGLLFFWAYLLFLTDLKIMIKNSVAKKYISVIIILLFFIKGYVTFDKIIYRYSNNIFEKDDHYIRSVNRDEFYIKAE